MSSHFYRICYKFSEDSQVAAKEANGLLAFLCIHLQIEPDYRPEAKRIIDEYNRKFLVVSAVGKTYSYLNHIASCPTEPETKRQRAYVLQQVCHLMDRGVAYLQREGKSTIKDEDQFKKYVHIIESSGSYLNPVTENIRVAVEQRKSFEDGKLELGKFLLKIGLSQEQFEEIGQIIMPLRKHEEDYWDWCLRWDQISLREALFAKYLASQGVIDIQSGFIRKLIKRIFPSFDERVWDIIEKKSIQSSSDFTSEASS